MSTLELPQGPTSPREDAAKLHKAFKGIGCHPSKIIKILAHRDYFQRDLIQQEYETAFSEPLSKRISSELHGNLKKAMLLWILDPSTRDATALKQAISGPVPDLQAITEIICSRSPSQIRRFKEIYLSQFRLYLEKEIEEVASGDHKKLLIEYVTTPRYEGPEFDDVLVEKDAKELYKAGEKRIGTDEKTFIRIFSERSSTHLAAVSQVYQNSHKHTLEKAIKKETSGHFMKALLTILRCAENPPLYFARILRKSMKGIGTDDSRLLRVIVTRAEIDMYHIKTVYFKKYGKTLKDAVKSDTSGHYKDFLLTLLGPDHPL
ncbi:hypothetical protein L6164_026606 [Bauhinia variegata]|uniref:Uncharacterized protein n=1 Tax=Bauhinia variegata TaxID=167791 RepID=A0ACB9LRL9_BAUVA|nr:hypothetical protein L6164_026606 [Bauhinia variegata]